MRVLKNLFGKNDHKIHVDEIAVKPNTLLGQAVIIESGTFDGGAYIKFGDGTMMAWKENLTVSYSSATNLKGTWNLPSQCHFLDTPRPAPIVAKNEYMGASAIRDGTVGGYANTSNGKTTQIDAYLMGSGMNSGWSVNVRVFVIGRWK